MESQRCYSVKARVAGGVGEAFLVEVRAAVKGTNGETAPALDSLLVIFYSGF